MENILYCELWSVVSMGNGGKRTRILTTKWRGRVNCLWHVLLLILTSSDHAVKNQVSIVYMRTQQTRQQLYLLADPLLSSHTTVSLVDCRGQINHDTENWQHTLIMNYKLTYVESVLYKKVYHNPH